VLYIARVCLSAIGCADPSKPHGGWWQREGPLSASSGCGQPGQSNSQLWHWTCSDDFKWIPDRDVINCTEAHLSGSGD